MHSHTYVQEEPAEKRKRLRRRAVASVLGESVVSLEMDVDVF